MSAWGHGDKLTLTSYQRRTIGWKSRGLHRLADEGSERKLSRLLSVCLRFIINISAWRGAANYHSAERKKNSLKEMTSGRNASWDGQKLKRGGFSLCRNNEDDWLAVRNVSHYHTKSFLRDSLSLKCRRWAVTLTSAGDDSVKVGGSFPKNYILKPDFLLL